MTGFTRLALMVAGALATTTASAIDIQRTETRFHDGRYELEIEATLEAPTEEVQRVLRDYALYPKLDERVLNTKILGRPSANEVLLYSRIRACVAFFCRRVERVERVEERHNEMVAMSIPEKSDVRFGLTQSLLSTTAESTTRIIYRTQFEPKFWVPRVLPKRVMLHTLRDATVDMLTEIERTAQRAAMHAELPRVEPIIGPHD